MAGLHDLLSRDHARLDQLLTSALRSDDSIDEVSYQEFRGGLLWHIAVEERVLLPAVRRQRGDSAVEQQLHRDHAALAALLVPSPTAAEIDAIRAILEAHNPLEEGPRGFYEGVEEIAGNELPAMLARIRDYPPVRLAPHADTAVTRRSIEQLRACRSIRSRSSTVATRDCHREELEVRAGLPSGRVQTSSRPMRLSYPRRTASSSRSQAVAP